jgi:hypothetical protein
MTARPLDTWRCALLAAHINELFELARAVDVPRYSKWADPRSEAALTMLERDPFVSAVWALDQAREFDLPGALDDVEHYCWRAECEIIARRARSAANASLQAVAWAYLCAA